MTLPPPGWRRDLWLAVLLALVAAVFRLPGLEYPPEEYFDEVYHAKAARQYLAGEAPAEWVHPPMAKLLIAIGVRLFGYEPWAWRLVPALAGTLLIVVFFFLARHVLASERGALLASTLLLADGVYLVQSRIAMTNIFAVLFQLGAVLLLLRATERERLPALGMLATGLALGLALSTRWTSLFAAAFLGLLLVVRRGRRLIRPRELALSVLAFAVLPAAVYVASYLPVRTLRPGLEPWHSFAELVALQKEVWTYHASLNATHPYFSKWYTWPWLYRPTWYFFKQEDGAVRGIVALGNPALWWASVPVTLWALVAGLRRRDPRLVFAGVGFCCLYLPWGLSPRTLNYSHYLFEAVPYACLSLAVLLDAHWDGARRELARGYVVTVVALFVLFLPFLTGVPVPSGLFFAKLGPFGLWTWFRSWI
jgi:dolichyl-phosphate-mannose--protein O-mannosyl transferase